MALPRSEFHGSAGHPSAGTPGDSKLEWYKRKVRLTVTFLIVFGVGIESTGSDVAPKRQRQDRFSCSFGEKKGRLCQSVDFLLAFMHMRNDALTLPLTALWQGYWLGRLKPLQGRGTAWPGKGEPHLATVFHHLAMRKRTL